MIIQFDGLKLIAIGVSILALLVLFVYGAILNWMEKK